MGCDIHIFLEYRRRPKSPGEAPGRWQNFGGEFYGYRSYGLFAKLAGVRDTADEPAVTPKGAPPDATFAFTSELKDSCWHSASWLTADEYAAAIENHGEMYAALLSAMRALEADGFETRMVFAFDN